MNNRTKALLGNLLFFGLFLLFYRLGLGVLLAISPTALMLFSALAASLSAPKFLVHKGRLFVKLPWKKGPKEV
ncbi:MAG: hypothetical protein ACON47_02100 [Flavobacteriaceae bacterium]